MIFDSKNKDSVLKITSYLIISVGIFLRLAQYFSNKSLWRDEAMLALNIMEKSFIDLLKPLDYSQYAPPGFLIIEKLIISILGQSEFSFRLFPLICGIASLFLFYKLIKKCLSPLAVPVALVLFSVLLCLNYYSSEAKQYSSDLLFTLLFILVAIDLKEKSTIFYFIIYALAGALVIWFSHVSVFVLPGVGLSIFVLSLIKKERIKSILILAACFLWIVSFLVFYFFSVSHIVKIPGLIDYWSNYYIPFPLHSTADFLKYKNIIKEFFRFTSLNSIAGICFLTGLVYFFQKKKGVFFILAMPAFITLIASVFHKYPIFERFVLFLIPATICFIAEGAEWIRAKTWNRFPLAGIIIIILLLYKPVNFTRINFTHPLTQEETKPVFKYIKEHLKNGDVIYVSDPLQFSFKYYAKNYNFCSDYSIKQDREKVEEAKCSEFNHRLFLGAAENLSTRELEKIPKNKRVWFIFSEKLSDNRADKAVTLNYLDKVGVKTGSFLRQGIVAYLYDLDMRSNH
ncbi:MAG: hypothetical protein A3I68_03235 [Candidatus Melainabacteria bacterium RIFCSPLOWO2_02_FULL_35_15]|nr:MAG: hypothetical protein A3F80_05300 [Candidatus Melainabacteria bacterium RIFCSPLOWO2_12_FULL_35_11]OGI13098.1 MAG: hypothetical protein A3I68_03235 [Candidatus Melainabacteria bacterium RIFCSPLOWO2_02_FULL_35_15]